MKIQTLVAAIALAVAGGAFAAPGASTSTDPKAGMSNSDMKAGHQATGKMNRQGHHAKQRAAHGHRAGASRGHMDKAGHHAGMSHMDRSGHHAGMSHMEMSKHMNSPNHMGASTGRMEPDMSDSQRRTRMDEAYANWRKSNG